VTSNYRLSPRAQRDVAEIWDYTSKRWGPQQAEDYVRQIRASIEVVAANPSIARRCEEIRAGYRKFPAGAHVLFLRQRTYGIEIVRILHGRMDFDRRL
jgi:toxin ParE1/3/4